MILALLTLALPGLAMADEPLASGTDYVVQPGDWLAKIADRHYGDASLYPAIVLATNAVAAEEGSYATIADPYLIEPGWKLVIPSVEKARAGLTVDALGNATYQSEWTASGKAPLVDGEYSEQAAPGSATRTVVGLGDRAAFGYAGDGEPFAVVTLITDPGGSGTFYDLAVVLDRGQGPVHVATTSLGDRVKIESLSVEKDEIVVRMIAHGANDPMCCPTQRVVERFALQDDQLVPLSSEVGFDGSEIVGITWQWERFIGGDDSRIDVDDPSLYTLTLKPDGSYQVKADCNLSTGAYTLQDGALTLQPGPTTLAECAPGSLYGQFLAKLGDVRTYVMDEGKLVLNLFADAGDMVFSRGQGTEGSAQEGGDVSVALGDMLWGLESWTDPQGELVAALPNVEITIEFQGDQVVGSAGCNRYFASYQLDGDRLTVGPIGATRMSCGSSVDEHESQYLMALESAASYRIVDGQLEILNAEGNTVLTFSEIAGAP
jgi:heat shock protein HslJ